MTYFTQRSSQVKGWKMCRYINSCKVQKVYWSCPFQLQNQPPPSQLFRQAPKTLRQRKSPCRSTKSPPPFYAVVIIILLFQRSSRFPCQCLLLAWGGIRYRSFAEEASEANIVWIFFGSFWAGPSKSLQIKIQRYKAKFVGKSRLMALMS